LLAGLRGASSRAERMRASRFLVKSVSVVIA
jgi:hypothetical protein